MLKSNWIKKQRGMVTMKVGIATVQVPFIRGGAESLVEMLKSELLKREYQTEIVTIPFKWYPWEQLINCMIMGRMIDITESDGEKIDKVIAMKFPSYYLKHENKVCWLMHQHRSAYDLWGAEYGDLHTLPNGEELRRIVLENDNRYLPEARNIFTIARTTSDRLMRYNHLKSEVLYHPPKDHEAFYCEEYGDYVFYPSRINPMKRQMLLISAAKYLKSDAKIVIAGTGASSEIEKMKSYIRENLLENKVKLLGYISDEEEIQLYSKCLAVYFGTYNEDYGYITLEGFCAQKPVIIHPDAGGPTEFVEDGVNGFVVEPDPVEIAGKIDALFENKKEAERLGKNGKKTITDRNMNWDHVIDRLLKG